jgi:hypothetical protein
MDQSLTICSSAVPDMSRHLARERLEVEITELAAHINAATYELLVLIGRYDAEQGWVQHGMASCAHWLQWRCGTNPGAAREKVRVARALPGLPQISTAFREGRVSYSKVRAMTRVATPENEGCLLNIARYGTAGQLEQVVRNYRMCERLKLLNEAREAHALRELNWHIDEDGYWVLEGRFTPEQGAVIRQALEKAMDALFDERQDEHPDVSAETPRGGIEEWQRPQPVATRRADALERLAESFLSRELAGASGGDRYVVNIHAEADVLAADGEAAHAECDDGGCVSAETSRRMACDAAVVRWHEMKTANRSASVNPAVPWPSEEPAEARRRLPLRPAAAASSMPTTSCTGPTAAKPPWTTSSCCAAAITAWCTRAASACTAAPATRSGSAIPMETPCRPLPTGVSAETRGGCCR